MAHIKKPSPDTGKVSTVRLTEGARVSRHGRTFYLCTQACPYRLAWLGTFPEVGDSLRLRKKNLFFYEQNQKIMK